MIRIWLVLPLLAGCPGFGIRDGNGVLLSVPESPTYDEHIQPMMEAYCVSCHGDSPSPDVPARFRLDIYTSEEKAGVFDWRTGVLARSMDTDAPMPPDPPFLDQIEIRTLLSWIENGAPKGDEGPKITITGNVFDLATKEPADEGLCATITDPRFGGGESTVLASTTIDASGGFTVTDIPTDSEFGLLASIADCEEGENTVWHSNTNIFSSAYQNLSEGDTLEIKPPSVGLGMLADIEASLVTAGETRSAEHVGAMIAWVRDSEGENIAGATLACEECGPFYYFDPDPSDGLFTSASGLNTATDESGRILLLEPPIATYTPAAEGFEFTRSFNGGLEGVATCTEFRANP